MFGEERVKFKKKEVSRGEIGGRNKPLNGSKNIRKKRLELV